MNLGSASLERCTVAHKPVLTAFYYQLTDSIDVQELEHNVKLNYKS